MPRTSLAVNVSGRRLDLMRAFHDASNADWLALQHATGRGPFALAQRVKMFEKMKDFAAQLERADDDIDAPEPKMPVNEGRFLETVTDLIFLARRAGGEKVTWAEVHEGTSFFDALGALNATGEAASVAADSSDDAEDPTTAPTGSDRGADAGPETQAAAKTASSRTSRRPSTAGC